MLERLAIADEKAAAPPPLGKQIFISYSHEPAENAAFVRNLAGRLTVAGFSVWLDEEQITGGDEVQEAILAAARASEVAIFVVTERWAKRPWTRHEVQLFGGRWEQKDGVRLIVLTRERIDYGYLGPYLFPLHRIDWFPDDEEGDARFWQIYCGIQNKIPGRRDIWAEQGRALTSRTATAQPATPTPARTTPAAKVSRPGDPTPLPIEGRPVDIVTGDNAVFVVSELDEWIAIGPGGVDPPVPRLSHVVARLGDSGEGLVVATCDSMLATLKEGGWDYRPLPTAALALCAGSDGLYAGTVSGSILSLHGRGAEQLSQLREPVIALAETANDALFVLGAQGLCGTVALAKPSRGEVTWLESGDIGRPVGLFPADDSDLVGLFGRTRFGTIDPVGGRLTACSKVWEQGVREVQFLGPTRWPYAVLTDRGELLFVSSNLDGIKPAPLPPGAVVTGCCGTIGRSLAIATTREGRLYRIAAPDRPADRLVDGRVVLAAPMSPRLSVAILWDEASGASMLMVDA